MCITKRYKVKIVQIYESAVTYSEEDINSFYNDVDETLGKPSHYKIGRGHFNVQMGIKTNHMETAKGTFELVVRYERGVTLVEWATSKKYKIMNTMFQKKPGRSWTWQGDVTKTEIDYILTKRQ